MKLSITRGQVDAGLISAHPLAEHQERCAVLVTFDHTGIDAGELATYLAGLLRTAGAQRFSVQAVSHEPALVDGWPASIA